MSSTTLTPYDQQLDAYLASLSPEQAEQARLMYDALQDYGTLGMQTMLGATYPGQVTNAMAAPLANAGVQASAAKSVGATGGEADDDESGLAKSALESWKGLSPEAKASIIGSGVVGGVDAAAQWAGTVPTRAMREYEEQVEADRNKGLSAEDARHFAEAGAGVRRAGEQVRSGLGDRLSGAGAGLKQQVALAKGVTQQIGQNLGQVGIARARANIEAARENQRNWMNVMLAQQQRRQARADIISDLTSDVASIYGKIRAAKADTVEGPDPDGLDTNVLLRLADASPEHVQKMLDDGRITQDDFDLIQALQA